MAKINEKLLTKTYVFGAENTISFTAPYSGILDVEYSHSGWGYGGNEYKVKITNTEGNATQLAYVVEKSSGHNTIPVPVRTRAFYRVEKGTTYTFVGDVDASIGGTSSKWIMAKLTP